MNESANPILKYFSEFKILKTVSKDFWLSVLTLTDFGDKVAECLDLGEDDNPAIGYRGIRVSLDKEELFKTQLRAILRASAFGDRKSVV